MARKALDWLTARPIAHRGLHDASAGVIENTPAAVRAAVAAGYGIEVDLQVSADGEAMVHHDDVVGRLTDGEGRLDRIIAADLKRVPFLGSDARMITLGELCDLVGGRVPILPELKSRFDGDPRLPLRVAAVLLGYRGPVAPMSFDPLQLQVLRQKAPALPRGIVAAKYRPHPYWDQMPPWLRHRMGSLLPALPCRPQFVAYAIDNLPALGPFLARRIFRLPLLTWVVRTPLERQRAQRFADQMIFESFRP
ncbi:MAG TPA: glycerophosphodiester phosphodiesterase family protein [Xanthobacteraceae bacterium]|nr:glycerophosphodiester phosphodiesterase family protein [Xanthobacteraceae bacterium]